MSKKTFLLYPCGKLFEIRVPIMTIGADGKPFSILPGTEDYFTHAKSKFEINNLKVVEKEVSSAVPSKVLPFISLTKKIRCVE